jgi:parallel beta-helix repeat protein
VHDNYEDGVQLYESSEITVSENDIKNNGFDGVYLVNTTDSIISGNNITDNGYTYGGAFNYNTISNKVAAAGSIGCGVFIDPSENITITGNNVAANYEDGVFLYESININVSENDITNNGFDGIYLNNTYDSTISGNNITDNGDIYSSSTLQGASIAAAGSIGCGVFIDPSENITFTDNNVNDNYESGIYLSESNDINISGNEIYSNGDDGVLLQYSTTTNISNNVIYDNDLYGVNVDSGSSDNDVADNDFIGNNIDSSVSSLSGASISKTSADPVVNPQANDNGNNNRFNGNWWIHHDNRDKNEDGVADRPAKIDGFAGNYDHKAKAIPDTYGHVDMDDIVVYVRFSPETLSIHSSGRWILANITLPEGYSVTSLNIDTIYIDGGRTNALKPQIVDQSTLHVKFERQEFIDHLKSLNKPYPYEIAVNVTGSINGDFIKFDGSDSIYITDNVEYVEIDNEEIVNIEEKNDKVKKNKNKEVTGSVVSGLTAIYLLFSMISIVMILRLTKRRKKKVL